MGFPQQQHWKSRVGPSLSSNASQVGTRAELGATRPSAGASSGSAAPVGLAARQASPPPVRPPKPTKHGKISK